MRNHDLCTDALLTHEDVHSKLQRGKCRIELSKHEIRQIHTAVRRPQKERASTLHRRNVLTGKAVVIHESPRIRLCLRRVDKKQMVELIRCHLLSEILSEIAEQSNPCVDV